LKHGASKKINSKSRPRRILNIGKIVETAGREAPPRHSERKEKEKKKKKTTVFSEMKKRTKERERGKEEKKEKKRNKQTKTRPTDNTPVPKTQNPLRDNPNRHAHPPTHKETHASHNDDETPKKEK
jgi:hypothetical protein